MWTMGVYDQVKKAFQDIIAPELHAIRGDIRVLDERISGLKTELLAEIRRVDTRIDGVNTRIAGLDQRMGGLEHRIDGIDRNLQIAIDVRERLAALEARRP